ncbi:MAG: hypothetical protein ING29_01600 [Azospirillum sp.]|nr:hypothetical protein [Azospirillum sp.]
MRIWILAALDGGIVVAAALSAWLWWFAASARLRRVTRDETLDAADINRIVVAVNRAQIRSARAAAMTGIAAALAGLRWAFTL